MRSIFRKTKPFPPLNLYSLRILIALLNHEHRLPIYDQKGCYYLTFQVVGWVDVFTQQCYRDILIEALRFSVENKDLKVHAYVVMSNYAHLILSARDGNLSARSNRGWRGSCGTG